MDGAGCGGGRGESELMRALYRLLIVFSLLPILLGGLNGLRNVFLARREAMYAEHRQALQRDALRRQRSDEAVRRARQLHRPAPAMQRGPGG